MIVILVVCLTKFPKRFQKKKRISIPGSYSIHKRKRLIIILVVWLILSWGRIDIEGDRKKVQVKRHWPRKVCNFIAVKSVGGCIEPRSQTGERVGPVLSTVFQRSSRRWSCSVNFASSSNILAKPQFIRGTRFPLFRFFREINTNKSKCIEQF